MSEHDEFPTTPEDAILDGYLRTLARFAPTSGFEDRVLTRVRAPLPVRLGRVRRRVAALAAPGRALVASALIGASSTAWIVAAASWLSGPRLQAAGAWLVTQVGVPAWSAT